MSTSGTPTQYGVISLPDDAESTRRRMITARRRRMLEGQWLYDASQMQEEMFGGLRTRLQGRPSLASNLFLVVITQLSKLYARAGLVSNLDVKAAEEMTTLLRTSGWWALAPRMQRYAEGLREVFVRPYWSETAQDVQFRIVTPDVVFATPYPDDPGRPCHLVEARYRELKGKRILTWDEYDLRGDTPTFRILDAGSSSKTPKDLTSEFAPDMGEYPWVINDRPVIPYATYHAAKPTSLFDPEEGEELVEGALTCSVLWTYWLTVVRSCAWSQRYIVGGSVVGADTSPSIDAAGVYRGVVTDPTTLLVLRQTGTDPVQVGQFNPPVDPQILGTALADFETRLAIHYGIPTSDIKQESGRSGYAISLERTAVREYTDQQKEVYRPADLDLITLVASIANGHAGYNFPTDGWGITYLGPKPSREENQGEIDEWKTKADLGIASRVDLYMKMNPGVDRDVAAAALSQIDLERRQFGDA